MFRNLIITQNTFAYSEYQQLVETYKNYLFFHFFQRFFNFIQKRKRNFLREVPWVDAFECHDTVICYLSSLIITS